MDYVTQAHALLNHYSAISNEASALTLHLAFDLKGYSTIGQCRQQGRAHYLIRLHQELCEHYGQVYLNDVIPHELAHALVMERYGRKAKPHGIEWKKTLRLLEGRLITRKERPTYPLLRSKRSRLRRHVYGCSCNKEHLLSSIRHNRIVRKTHLYRCLTCKSVLAPK